MTAACSRGCALLVAALCVLAACDALTDGRPVGRVRVAPAADTIWTWPLDTLVVEATVCDRLGNVLSDPVVTWASSDTAVATVRPASTARGGSASRSAVVTPTGHGIGTVLVTAEAGASRDTCVVTVGARITLIAFVEDSSAIRSGQVGRTYGVVRARVGERRYWGSSREDTVPIVGEAVRWEAISGWGYVSVAATVTDSAGEARTVWTLGQLDGGQTLSARRSSGEPITMTVFAAADTTAQLSFVRPGRFCLLRLADRTLGCVPWDGAASGYSWSPAGDRVAFTSSRSGNAELYTSRPDGSDQVRLTHTVENETGPAWSPDGSWIAVSSDSGRIRLVAPDGSRDTALSPPDSRDWEPTWAPDGARLAVVAQIPDSTNFPMYYSKRIELISLDGSRTPLPATTRKYGIFDVASPAWSPDGSQIAYTEGSQAPEWRNWATLFVTTGGAEVSGRFGGMHPSWSPDGNGLAYEASAYECTDLCRPVWTYIKVRSRAGAWDVSLVPWLRNSTRPRWRPVAR